MSKTKNDKDAKSEDLTGPEDPADGTVGYQPTPGQEPGPSAATLEEALAQQDAAAREANEDAAAEAGAEKAEVEAETNAAIAEAGAAQEARDDEVYGRTPAEPEAEATPASE